MRLTTVKRSPTVFEITVLVPAGELEPLLRPAAARLAAELEIPGFRKGKAPYEAVRERAGEFKILEAAAQQFVREHLDQVLAEAGRQQLPSQSFEPVSTPDALITKLAPGEELEYRITFSILPLIVLPDYRAVAKKILATRRQIPVSDEEVRAAIQRLCDSRAALLTVNRPVESGDRVEIDFSGSVNNKPVGSLQSKNHPLVIGAHRFLAGFEEQLVGMSAGEEKRFWLQLPLDFRDSNLAGKPVEFSVSVRLVQKREIPAFDDAFARRMGDFASAAAFENSVREGLEFENKEAERERLRKAMAEAIARETGVDIPSALIDQELERMLGELAASVQDAGLTLDAYLGHLSKTPEALRTEWRPDAEERIKIALALREIARVESIEPAEEEVRASLRRSLERAGMGADDAGRLDRAALAEYHRGVLRNERVLEFLEAAEAASPAVSSHP